MTKAKLSRHTLEYQECARSPFKDARQNKIHYGLLQIFGVCLGNILLVVSLRHRGGMHAALILETPSAAKSLAHDGSYLTDLSWESKALLQQLISRSRGKWKRRRNTAYPQPVSYSSSSGVNHVPREPPEAPCSTHTLPVPLREASPEAPHPKLYRYWGCDHPNTILQLCLPNN